LAFARPLYLDTGRDSAFTLYHSPADSSAAETGVVVCAPWGWDEVASYRIRCRWAEHLAAAGHPALRFDLPAGGDSAAVAADAGLVESWVAAIAAAADWLRAESGAPRIALLGLGLGGLLAREAIARGTVVEELILWGAPSTGRHFVREARAFSAMQDWSGDEAIAALLPAGSVEAGGFVLSDETKGVLNGLDPEIAPGSHLRRALLLQRDGVAVDQGLTERIEGAGVEVDLAAGPGWGVMVSHPERSKLSLPVAEEVERWLAAGAAPGDAASAAPESSESLSLRPDGVGVRETPWVRELDFGKAFGILTEPAAPSANDCCAVFLNAGAIRHIGPNRLWVEAARRAAARGTSSLRVDLEAIGEADGDEDRLREVGEFFVPEYADQVRAVLDALEERGVAKRFVLIGLCAGAYWSFQAALRDPRVRSTVMFNSGALAWHPDLVTDRGIRDLHRLREPEWWRMLFTGKHRMANVGAAVGLLWRKARQLARRLRHGLRGRLESRHEVDVDLDRLRELDTRVTLAFSGGEDLHFELTEAGVFTRLQQWPNVALEELPGDDHSLRPIPAQEAAAALIDRELARFEPTGSVAPRAQRSSIA
jgi:alpha-beta hydrolase superfamily lysophospholipase